MSADPPSSRINHERSRHWITDVQVTPGNSDPNCKFSARMFVDDELVCDLPAIDSTRPLQWSGLLLCNVSLASTLTLRLCKTIGDRPRYFNFPPYVISHADEETGEATLELPNAVWVITVKSLTPGLANQLFPNELERFNVINGVYDSLQPEATLKYQFKHALHFASVVARALPESTAKVSFLIYMRAWELLDRQAQLDETVQAILRGLTRIQDILGTVNQASSSILATALIQTKEAIHGILELLEDASTYIYNQYTLNNLAHASSKDVEAGDTYDVKAYFACLEGLQNAFYSSWSPTGASPDATHAEDNQPSDGSQLEDNNRTLSDESEKTG
ncbi:unnamed protein product [Rhizoctonia solani]|uniref:Vegetative incompatibility protein HET-E-1 n=1 Tax=Rhizoctonia solani TaxID=456999 RepID=A0A8H2XFE5_9AGAM|nr:unnamed protein product [Rhizoctonia solani]